LTNLGAIRLLGGIENTVIVIGLPLCRKRRCLAWHDQWSGTAVFHAKALRLAQMAPKEGEWAEIL